MDVLMLQGCITREASLWHPQKDDDQVDQVDQVNQIEYGIEGTVLGGENNKKKKSQ